MVFLCFWLLTNSSSSMGVTIMPCKRHTPVSVCVCVCVSVYKCVCVFVCKCVCVSHQETPKGRVEDGSSLRQ